jgi:hypothetical protein
MKLRVIYWLTIGSVLVGLLYWRNTKYSSNTIWWKLSKSLIELCTLVCISIRFPVLLVSWTVLWLTKPIKTGWIKVTVGAISGAALGFCAIFALEIPLVLSVFGIDQVTGDKEGFLSNLRKAKENYEHRKKS